MPRVDPAPDMREPDEAPWVVSLCPVHVVVDQAALGRVRLIESRATGEHCKVDACPIHHPHRVQEGRRAAR